MRWIVRLQDERADAALDWARRFFGRYDTSSVAWLKIDRGRGAYEGVYGRCWYPTQQKPLYRISCQVPGPFPCDILTRKSPIYPREDGTFPRAPRGCRRTQRVHDPRTGRHWIRVVGRTALKTIDEGVVWIVAHEAFHFLRRSRQIPGRDNEIEADRFGDACLETFRSQPAAVPALSETAPSVSAQMLLFG